jgi:hypothetical protein
MHGTRTFTMAAALFCLFPAWLHASSKIPISYIPRRTMAAIRSYVPGARIIKAEIGSDDTWGRTYRCEYFRGHHKGSIKISERGRLMDLSQEVDPGEMPPTVARVAARESRHGLIRRVSLDEDDGRLVYKVKAYYGQSGAKIKLKITRSGQLLGRDFD